MTKREINSKSIGRKVYVLTKEGGWYGVIKEALDDSFLVASAKNGREHLVDMFDVRYPEDPILE